MNSNTNLSWKYFFIIPIGIILMVGYIFVQKKINEQKIFGKTFIKDYTSILWGGENINNNNLEETIVILRNQTNEDNEPCFKVSYDSNLPNSHKEIQPINLSDKMFYYLQNGLFKKIKNPDNYAKNHKNYLIIKTNEENIGYLFLTQIDISEYFDEFN